MQAECHNRLEPKGWYLKKDSSKLKKVTFYLTTDLIIKLKNETVNKDVSLSILVQKVMENYFL